MLNVVPLAAPISNLYEMVPGVGSLALAVSVTVVPSGCGDGSDVTNDETDGAAMTGLVSVTPAATTHPARNNFRSEVGFNLVLQFRNG